MKKKVTIVLEVENDEKELITDEFIANDLKAEINCASNYYEVIDISTETIE